MRSHGERSLEHTRNLDSVPWIKACPHSADCRPKRTECALILIVWVHTSNALSNDLQRWFKPHAWSFPTVSVYPCSTLQTRLLGAWIPSISFVPKLHTDIWRKHLLPINTHSQFYEFCCVPRLSVSLVYKGASVCVCVCMFKRASLTSWLHMGRSVCASIGLYPTPWWNQLPLYS